jgi:hypothetical protein
MWQVFTRILLMGLEAALGKEKAQGLNSLLVPKLPALRAAAKRIDTNLLQAMTGRAQA